MNQNSDHDLERYHLGMVKDEEELAALEKHYLGCLECAELAEKSAEYVDTIRAAIITGNFDLERGACQVRSPSSAWNLLRRIGKKE